MTIRQRAWRWFLRPLLWIVFSLVSFVVFALVGAGLGQAVGRLFALRDIVNSIGTPWIVYVVGFALLGSVAAVYVMRRVLNRQANVRLFLRAALAPLAAFLVFLPFAAHHGWSVREVRLAKEQEIADARASVEGVVVSVKARARPASGDRFGMIYTFDVINRSGRDLNRVVVKLDVDDGVKGLSLCEHRNQPIPLSYGIVVPSLFAAPTRSEKMLRVGRSYAHLPTGSLNHNDLLGLEARFPDGKRTQVEARFIFPKKVCYEDALNGVTHSARPIFAAWIDDLELPTGFGIDKDLWTRGQPGDPGSAFRECKDCPEMVVVPAGAITLGSEPDEPSRQSDEGPRTLVTVDGPFAVGRFEVTVSQWTAFSQATGRITRSGCWQTNTKGTWRNEPDLHWTDPGHSTSRRHPVSCISWDDAQAYIAWLNTQVPNGTYRLMTEAEWEYAAHGGRNLNSAYYWGDDRPTSSLCEYANGPDAGMRKRVKNWVHAPCSDGHIGPAPVGSFKPNGFGLYDISGNVWEWVADCYKKSYAGRSRTQEAYEPDGSCSKRARRGGSWIGNISTLRTANRADDPPNARRNYNGLRVARSLEQ